MPMVPRVSVVIPTYNRATVLPRAIRSVLSQDHPDFEVIVVDDCSTDNTREVVAQFSDSRLRFVEHEKNKGAGAARNTGIRAAKGELIAFQDSDDEWLDGKLSRQVAALIAAGDDCVCVYCTLINYGRDSNAILGGRRVVCVPGPEFGMQQLEGDLSDVLLSGSLVSTQTMLCKKKDLERVGGFDERLSNLIDWDLCLRLSEIGSFCFVDIPLVNTYTQNDSISSLSRKLPYSQLRILNKLKRRDPERYETNPLIADRLGRVGWWLGKIGHTARGEILLRASLSAQPLRLKTWGRLLGNRILSLRRGN
ncbi:MAG: glycosyltransferase [Lentisphaeria bacterium]|nr:glycosyltransferase [Lentisphaeria bacterium]